MRKSKGFSLIEVVVVMAIVAILIAISIPSLTSVLQQTNKSKIDQAIRTMNSSIVRNLQDFNGVTMSQPSTTLNTALTPILINDNDIITSSTTISYFGYYYDNLEPVRTQFTQIRNSTTVPASPDDFNITIALPDNEVHTGSNPSITFNLNHSVYIIVKTVDNTYIYKNGVDVTDDFLTTTP